MSIAERLVQLLGFGVEPLSRARFLEEWQADLVASRELGLPESQIVLAAARVTAFLLWTEFCGQIRRGVTRTQLVMAGVLLGAASTVVDLPLVVLAPFGVFAVAWWAARGVRRWIGGAA